MSFFIILKQDAGPDPYGESRESESKFTAIYRIAARFVCRISSNNNYYFWHKKGTIFRGRRLFQILLTGSRALNILFYFPIK